jgi:cytochrome d ubiquinol oxidase subunit I
MYEQQPMKMASAEAACHDGTQFSVLTVGNLDSNDCDDVTPVIEIPGVLSFLANGDFTTDVPGVQPLIPEYQEAYGTYMPDDPMYGKYAGQEIDYQPSMFVTYWGFRIMIGFGALAAAAAVFALIVTRKGTVPQSKFLSRLALWGIAAPFIANSAGWIFTEMGRQPFVVAPNPDPSGIDGVFLFTAAAVSPTVTPAMLLTSLAVFALLYGVLMVFELKLIIQYARGGVVSAMPELAHDRSASTRATATGDEDDVLSFAY